MADVNIELGTRRAKLGGQRREIPAQPLVTVSVLRTLGQGKQFPFRCRCSTNWNRCSAARDLLAVSQGWRDARRETPLPERAQTGFLLKPRTFSVPGSSSSFRSDIVRQAHNPTNFHVNWSDTSAMGFTKKRFPLMPIKWLCCWDSRVQPHSPARF